MGLTQEVAHYVAKTRYQDIPSEVIRAARGFVLDGLGVALAGVTEESSRIVLNHVRQEQVLLGDAFARVADLDLDQIREVRNVWQFFRDRRPETYDELTRD